MATVLAGGDFGNLLKMVYEPGIQSQLMDEVPVLAAFEQAGADELELATYTSSSGVQVSGFQWALELAVSGGVGHTGESTSATTGNVFPAGVQQTAKAGAPERQCYGRIKLTNNEIQASRQNNAAFATALKFKMDALTKECRRVADSALWGKKPMLYNATSPASFTELFTQAAAETNYPVGVLGQVVAAADVTSGTTFVMDFVTSPQHFWPGRKILLATQAEYEDGSAASAGTYRTVTDVSINAAGTQVTVTVSAAFANSAGNIVSNNDFVVSGASLTGTAAAGDPNEFDAAIIGIPNICIHPLSTANEALYGVSNTTYSQWLPRASMYNVGTLTQPRVNAWLRNYGTVSGKKPSVIFGHGSAVDAMADLIQPDVRYEPVELVGGYNRDGFHWMSGTTKVPVQEDPYAPLGDLYCWNFDCLKLGYTQKWEWVADPDGGRFLRQADKVTWEAIFGAIWQTVCFQRNACAALTGISIDYTSLAFGA